MVKKRVIPKLLLKKVQFGNIEKNAIITTTAFEGVRLVGDPVSQAKVYEGQNADELLFVDIFASRENRTVDSALVKELSLNLFTPFTVGGGIHSVETARDLFKNGADKICLNSAALNHLDIVRRCSECFGAQSIVVSVDYKLLGKDAFIFHPTLREFTKRPLMEYLIQCEKAGAGEILLTSVERDGKKTGFDNDTIQNVVETLHIPVVASGGCGSINHFVECFQKTDVSAVAAGTFFSFKDENPLQTKAQLKNHGIHVR